MNTSDPCLELCKKVEITAPVPAAQAMGGGRQPDAVWQYAKANPDKSMTNKPYVDIFQGSAHSDNATKFKLWLAFDCPKFMRTKAHEWQTAGWPCAGQGGPPSRKEEAGNAGEQRQRQRQRLWRQR